MNGIIDAVELAYLIVNMSVDNRDYISNLKLQKLLYLIQVEYIRIYGQPLFENKIEAWRYGPVVPSVYREFSKFGGGVIDQKISREIFRKKGSDIIAEKIMIDRDNGLGARLSEDIISLIENQLDIHATNSPWDLVELSHRRGGTWEKKYNSDRNEEITIEDIFNIELNS